MDVKAVLADQLRMNAQTWKAMVDRGVTEQSSLQLDFAYVAPDERAATALSTFLQRETDYRVTRSATKKNALSRKAWSVDGTTNSTQVSLDVLNQWVEWMVLAGHENGQCQFDGWGAQLPRASGS